MKRKVRSKARSKAKITTIEGLAAAMAEGFADVAARFDAMDAKFDALASDVRDLDRRLTAVESKLDGILRRLDDEAMERMDVRSLQARMDRIEEHLFGQKQT
jgi:predicted RNase H-like nuclease (RuvC/YqgF family)